MATWYLTPPPDDTEPGTVPQGWNGVLKRNGRNLSFLRGAEPIVSVPCLTPDETYALLKLLPEPVQRLVPADTLRVDLPDGPHTQALIEAAKASGLLLRARRAGSGPGWGVVNAQPGCTEKARFRGPVSSGGIGLGEVRLARARAEPDGSGARIAVVERGWLRDHGALPPAWDIQQITTHNPNLELGHGTQTLGVLAMRDNGAGSRGLVHRASIGVAAPYFGAAEVTTDTIARAILAAACWAGPGGVVLVEEALSLPNSDSGDLPIECADECLVAIAMATLLNTIVVEPAGNSGTNLDDSPYVAARLNRNSIEFVDSGAILVGGVFWNYVAEPKGWEPSGFTYGSRVDCAADAYGVYTTQATGGHASAFGGTSSASAIVAGILGLMAADRQGDLSPATARALLRDPENALPVEGDPRYFGAGVPNVGMLLRATSCGSGTASSSTARSASS